MAKYMLATGFPGTILDPISWKRPVPPETNWENPRKPANNAYTTVKTKEINKMTRWRKYQYAARVEAAFGCYSPMSAHQGTPL
jgi:hypothetical protein